MTASTDVAEHCPRCRVLRAPLNTGGWCETCGFNPAYEAQLHDLRSALAAQVLRCPKIQYDGIHTDNMGFSYVRLWLSRDEWDRWVHPGERPT